MGSIRTELGDQFARKSAQAGVTFARYWIIARTSVDRAATGIDWAIGWFKRYEGVKKIVEALEGLGSGGPPPA